MNTILDDLRYQLNTITLNMTNKREFYADYDFVDCFFKLSPDDQQKLIESAKRHHLILTPRDEPLTRWVKIRFMDDRENHKTIHLMNDDELELYETIIKDDKNWEGGCGTSIYPDNLKPTVNMDLIISQLRFSGIPAYIKHNFVNGYGWTIGFNN